MAELTAGHKAFARELYPSYTVVHLSPADFKTAKLENIRPSSGGKGIFCLAENARTGTLESAAFSAPFIFDTLLLSVNAALPEGSSVSAGVSVGRLKNGQLNWSKWLDMGTIAPDGKNASHSCRAENAEVREDTLFVKNGAAAFRYRITLSRGVRQSPELSLVAVNYFDSKAPYSASAAVARGPFGGRKPYEVAPRCQMIQKSPDAKRICSPTALSMLLDFAGANIDTLDVAHGVYDETEKIYGNWAFNAAFAGSLGFDAYLSRVASFAEAEFLLAQGFPFAASITYGEGELFGAPRGHTAGHLVVLLGFDADGSVVVNDPAADGEDGVRRIYRRAEFAKAWLENKRGLAYIVRPRLPKLMVVSSASGKLSYGDVLKISSVENVMARAGEVNIPSDNLSFYDGIGERLMLKKDFETTPLYCGKNVALPHGAIVTAAKRGAEKTLVMLAGGQTAELPSEILEKYSVNGDI